MYTTHFKGIIGELEFITHLIKKDYSVLTPINPNSIYDLVLEQGGKFTRIQVKYLTPKYGRLRVELDRPKRQTKAYKDRGVDAMGIFDSKNKKFYLIPISYIRNKSEIWLRVEKPKNSQVKNINLASKFEI